MLKNIFWYLCLLSVILVLTVPGSLLFGQCVFTSYTLSPSGNVCGSTTTTITLSGSQTGVNYQLSSTTEGNIGSVVAGTGAALSWTGVSIVNSSSFAITAIKSGCSNAVIATTNINYLPAITSSDVVIAADKAALYAGDSITFTVTHAAPPTGNAQVVFSSYMLFDGSPVGGSTTSNTFTVKTVANNTYRILVMANCGSAMVDCPSFAYFSEHLWAGSLSAANTSIAYNTAPGVLTLTGTTGGSSSYTYHWQKSMDNTNWADVSVTSSASYSPGQLLTSTYYRVRVEDGYEQQYSSPVYIQVTEPPVVTNIPSLSTVHNYIATWTATAPMTGISNTTPLSDAKLSVTYIDGLGRPEQIVVKQGSLSTAGSSSGDFVTPVMYDSYGRTSNSYLPYVASSGDGSFKADAVQEQENWYGGSASPVAGQGELGTAGRDSIFYEASPLNRILKQMSPGNSWVGSGHGVEQGYYCNSLLDSVRLWQIGFKSTLDTALVAPTSSSYYTAASLYKHIITDEVGHQIIEFKDKRNHIVLKKVQLTAPADDGSGAGHSGWLCTYYIYDDLSRLRCVIQPVGVDSLRKIGWELNSTLLDEQCFRYEYDSYDRMIIKKVPGAGAIYMVYDARDRMVMTQDANLRKNNLWIATKYDQLNRADSTWLDSLPGSSFNTLLTAAANSTSYPSGSITTANLLTATHYDDYSDVSLPIGVTASFKSTWNSLLTAASTTTFPYPETPTAITPTSTVSTKGLVTWTQVRVLGVSPAAFITTVNFYDDKSRLIQTQTNNITGGVNIQTTQYSWSGQPLMTVGWQSKLGTRPDTSITVTRLTYDYLNRLVKTEMKTSNSRIAGGSLPTNYTLVSSLEYDALGQVSKKSLGNQRTATATYSVTPLETERYEYNIRGWLLGVNKDYVKDYATTDSLTITSTTQTIGGENMTESGQDTYTVTYPDSHYFGYVLGYDNGSNADVQGEGFASSQLTGNISGMFWKSASDSKVRKYDYIYDPVNRLTGAGFKQYDQGGYSNSLVDYSVSGLSYDGNGNILSMNQKGFTDGGSSNLIDQLSYRYYVGTNKLKNVSDGVNDPNTILGDFHYPQATKTQATIDYSYDANGNMVSDANKSLQISYNYLNLPSVITVSGRGTITYIYDASGSKLQKKTIDNTVSPAITTVTKYIGASVYQNDTLQFFGMTEGRVRANEASSAFVYDYFLKDHLGNTRLMITDDYDVQSPILEAYSYYPFGLQQKGINVSQSGGLKNSHLFNGGCEFNNDFSLGFYSTIFRLHDPQLGRFMQIDPLAHDFLSATPFSFGNNNPVLFNDPLGDSTDAPGFPDSRIGANELPDVVVGNHMPYTYGQFASSYDNLIESGLSDREARRIMTSAFPFMTSVERNLYDNATYYGNVNYRIANRKVGHDAAKPLLYMFGFGLAAPLAAGAAPEVVISSLEMKLTANTTSFIVDAASQTLTNVMNGKNIISNYNLVSGVVAFGLGVPEGAPLKNLIGGSLLNSAISNSVNVSIESMKSGRILTFHPKSILLNTTFGFAGSEFGTFIGNSSRAGQAFGDAVSSPIIFSGAILDNETD